MKMKILADFQICNSVPLIQEKKPIANFAAISLKTISGTSNFVLKSPKLIGQKSLSYGHLLKDKRLKFTFLREPIFQVLLRGSLPPKKT